MANWLLGESAAQAVADYLSANVAAQITAVMADYSDGFSPGTVALVATAGMVEQDILANGAPVLEVFCDRTKAEDLTGSYGNFMHEISVTGTVMDDSDPTTQKTQLDKRVKRLARACALTMRAAQTADGLSNGFQLVKFGDPMLDYAPVMRHRNRSQAIGGFVLSLVINKTEAG